jgi:hypothetical protein
LKKFKDTGISENQVDIQTLGGRSLPGRVIIETAEKGNYGTVVIGKRGINRSSRAVGHIMLSIKFPKVPCGSLHNEIINN